MKHIINISIFLGVFILNAQNNISTPFFTYNCDCKEVENEYNPANQSYNYIYETNIGNTIYMFSTRNVVNRDENQQSDFLNSIKNSNTYDYVNTSFRGEKAILADIMVKENFGKHLAFFSNNTSYTVLIISDSKEELEKKYARFNLLKKG